MTMLPLTVDVPLPAGHRPLRITLASVTGDPRPSRPGGYLLEPRRRTTHLLTYIQRGSNLIHVDGRPHPLARGEAMLIWTGEVLQASFGQAGEPFCAHNVAFTTTAEDAQRLPTLFPRRIAPADANEELAAALRRLLHSARTADAQLVRIDLQSVMLQAQRAAIAAQRQRLSTPVRKALRYIHDHAARPIRREHVAAAAGVGPTHLSAIVREQTGETLSSHVRRARVAIGRSLLEDPSLSITAVAARLGLDAPQFTKLFRAVTGVTPTHYRRSLAI